MISVSETVLIYTNDWMKGTQTQIRPQKSGSDPSLGPGCIRIRKQRTVKILLQLGSYTKYIPGYH